MKLFTLILFSLFSFYASAQDNTSRFGSVYGKVMDVSAKKPIELAVVKAVQNGIVRGAAYTEEDGTFELRQLPPGEYRIVAEEFNHTSMTIECVQVVANEKSWVPISMVAGTNELPMIKCPPPFINPVDTSNKALDKSMIIKAPTRNITQLSGGCFVVAYDPGSQGVLEGYACTGGMLPLSRAKISLVNADDTTITYETFTDTNGHFRLAAVVGDYTLQAGLTPFKTITRECFHINPGPNKPIDLVLFHSVFVADRIPVYTVLSREYKTVHHTMTLQNMQIREPRHIHMLVPGMINMPSTDSWPITTY